MNIENHQDIFIIIFLFYFSGLGNKKNKKSKEDPSLVSQSLIYQAGETSNLPCDISVPQNHAPNDELMLIMWYREDVRSPIYSIGMFCKNRPYFCRLVTSPLKNFFECGSGKKFDHINFSKTVFNEVNLQHRYVSLK